jgi:hypothetical protein
LISPKITGFYPMDTGVGDQSIFHPWGSCGDGYMSSLYVVIETL